MSSTILERLRNSDYSKIIRLLNTQEPKYCFGLISACRGLDIQGKSSVEITQHNIDENNHNNNVNSGILMHNLKANKFGVIEVRGTYREEGIGLVEEISYLVYTPEDRKEELKAILIELGKVFKQDTIMIIDNHIGKLEWLQPKAKPSWIDKFNNSKPRINFNQDDLSDIFTRVGTRKHGRKFRVVSLEECYINYNITTLWAYDQDPCILKGRKMKDPKYLKEFENNIKNRLDNPDEMQ